MLSGLRVACVGAGFSGAVIARTLAEAAGLEVDVFETHDYVGGHCLTDRDERTGVMVHRHGPHIFNTQFDDVWEFVNRFASFGEYVHKVRAVTSRGVFGLPINLRTLNEFFGEELTAETAPAFLAKQGDASITEPRNFEEQALRMLGRELYEAFFQGYTRKQWGVDPTELPASIFKRLPVRMSYDDNYHISRYTGIPTEGYSQLIANILDHPRLRLRLGHAFEPADATAFDRVFHSGPLDGWFGRRHGRLRYRSLRFEAIYQSGDYQGTSQVNFCEESVPWTRITEHKHFASWEDHAETVAHKEYSFSCGADDTPYYPLRLVDDRSTLAAYVDLAEREGGNLTFVGRLGTYRYLNMDQVIKEALDTARGFLASPADIPRFSADPL